MVETKIPSIVIENYNFRQCFVKNKDDDSIVFSVKHRDSEDVLSESLSFLLNTYGYDLPRKIPFYEYEHVKKHTHAIPKHNLKFAIPCNADCFDGDVLVHEASFVTWNDDGVYTVIHE